MSCAVITGAVRTAVGAYLGSLKTVPPEELAVPVLKEVLVRSGITPNEVEQVIMGDVLSAEPNLARTASLMAGYKIETPAYKVDRQCGSALQAVINAVQAIRAGDERVIVAGGTETMSRSPYYLAPEVRYQGYRAGNSQVIDAFAYATTHSHPHKLYPDLNMGLTAENVARRYDISREMQDQFAYESQMKYKAAYEAGKFREEILPVVVKRGKKEFLFSVDEHPRMETTRESLAALKPAFLEDGTGTVTAGNSSGMNDGASAVVVMDEDRCMELGCVPLVRILATSAAGVDPSVMGLGPVPVVRDLLTKTGLTLNDIDLFELNEAFAAQSLGCLIELGMGMGTGLYKRVNVNGGAIAHGHALGNSGTRILTTMIYEMRRRDARYGIAALCCGGGQGVGILIENCAKKAGR